MVASTSDSNVKITDCADAGFISTAAMATSWPSAKKVNPLGEEPRVDASKGLLNNKLMWSESMV